MRRYLVGSVGAAAAIALLPSLSSAHTAAAADGDTTYGASFPYTRYEAERGRLDRAHVVSLNESLSINKMLDSTAIEAGEQSYVELECEGSSVSFTAKEKKLRGMSIGDNPRRDWDRDEPQHLVVNYARVNGKVDRGIREDANYSLYWWDGDRVNPVDGKTHRYWIPKADGVQINDGMKFSWEGNKKVYNFILGDDPQYLPTSSTRFLDDYTYQGEMARSFQDPSQPQTVVRFWSHK